MDRIKKLKIKKQDGTFSDYIPIGADAENIDTTDGESVETKLNKKPYYYNSVADMKADTKLKAGDMAITLGYYEANDGGAGEYKIISGDYTDDGGSYHQLKNGLFAELVMNGNNINVLVYGVKGDGIADDSIFIQKAITKACSLMQDKARNVKSFGGGYTVTFPARKLFLKTQINVTEPISLMGEGVGSTLFLNNNLDYMIKFEKLASSKGTNEEGRIEGGLITNLRFDGNAREYTCIAALGLWRNDHITLDNLYFYGIKGKCIEFKSLREGVINNIYTRFCGVLGSGNIDVIENTGGDTTNLNFGNNWNIVYPFGYAINFNYGEFISITGLMIHGMFQGIIDSLTSYFGSNDYSDINTDFIRLNHSQIHYLKNCSTAYIPMNSGIAILDNNSELGVSDTHFSGHLGTSSRHLDGHYFFNLTNSSTLFIYGGVYCSEAYQNGDIIIKDNSSKVQGYFANISTYLYLNDDDMEARFNSSNIVFAGNRTKPVNLTYREFVNYKKFGEDDCRASIVVKSPDDNNGNLINPDALYIGTNRYNSRSVVAIPDESYFVLPKNTSISYSIPNTLFVNDNHELCFIYKDSNGNYITKKISMQ